MVQFAVGAYGGKLSRRRFEESSLESVDDQAVDRSGRPEKGPVRGRQGCQSKQRPKR